VRIRGPEGECLWYLLRVAYAAPEQRAPSAREERETP